jgi:hypothetical protein
MDPNHPGNDHTTSPAEYGPVDTDKACILEPQHGICCGYRLLGLRDSSGEYRGSDEGVLVPESLTGRHEFVGVMAVIITRCAGTQNLWEFWYAIDEDVLEVGQSSNVIGWVVVLMVWCVAEAAFWPWLRGFLTIYDGRSMDIFGNGGMSKKHNRPLKIMKIKI